MPREKEHKTLLSRLKIFPASYTKLKEEDIYSAATNQFLTHDNQTTNCVFQKQTSYSTFKLDIISKRANMANYCIDVATVAQVVIVLLVNAD